MKDTKSQSRNTVTSGYFVHSSGRMLGGLRLHRASKLSPLADRAQSDGNSINWEPEPS